MSKTTGTTEVAGAALLYKAFRLIDAVAESKHPPRISDLLKTTGLSKGTLYRLLQALIDQRYLRVDADQQTYHLGTHLFDLSHAVWANFDLRSAAAPEMAALRDKHGETVRLSVLDGYNVLHIDQIDAVSELRVARGVGNRVPAHASAAGKIMLSALDPLQKSHALSRLSFEVLTPNTIGNEDLLRTELDLAKARGFATSIDERVAGISSVSAAILDVARRPVGAITIAGPSSRLSVERLNELGPDLMEAARRIAGLAGIASPASASSRPKRPIPRELTCFLESRSIQGEGPIWDPAKRTLYWVDILAPALHVFDFRSGRDRAIPMPWMLSAVGRTNSDRVVLVTKHGVQLFDPATSRLSVLADPEEDLPENRLNDAKVDRKGRLWVGSMSIAADPGQGSLYRIDGHGSTVKMDRGFSVANGMGWSPDNRRMYLCDSGAGRIYSYDFDLASGEIRDRKVLVDVPDSSGRPGGMTVDSEGYLWVAHFDGWSIGRYAPDGRLDRLVPMPIPRPTSVMFGGTDLKELFITSARIRLSAERIAEAPLSGSVFRLQTDVPGLPEPHFDIAPSL
jgi:sugar lactone lactonase YvrE/DNA-binding IclR family transcriptional regulator